jgi:Superfamily I DNA and RNA helicases
LRAFYKEKFRYIMIDEFQDNNKLQKELLYLLSERSDLALDDIPKADELNEKSSFSSVMTNSPSTAFEAPMFRCSKHSRMKSLQPAAHLSQSKPTTEVNLQSSIM